MEDTLKLILEKITQMDTKITRLDTKVTEIDTKMFEMDTKIFEINQKLDTKADKSDIVRIENTLGDKVKALFDDREVKADALKRIEDKVDTIHNELNNIEKVTIKNSADIIDLQSYRKEN